MPSAPRPLELGLLAVVVALAAFGASAALRAATWTVPPPDDADAERLTATAPPPLDAYAIVAARDVFNPAPAGEGLRIDDLVLQGVGIHGPQAHAVLEDVRSRQQRLVRVGDDVGGARVAAIAWDRVTLARGTAEATLELRRTPPDDAATAAASPPVEAPAPGPSIRRTTGDAFIVDRRELAGAVDNMSGLLTQLRAVAQVEDGRPAGFRLFQIDEQSIFRRLGLENGDVVQRVNGKPVGDPATLLAFLQRLRTEPRVALDIVRGSAPRTLVYDLR